MAIVALQIDRYNPAMPEPREWWALADAEAVARALVSLFEGDDDEALARVRQWAGQPRTAEVTRRHVRLALGRPETTTGHEALTLEDARLVVARSREFDSWQALEDALRDAGSRPLLTRAVTVAASSDADAENVTARHWDDVLRAVAARRMTALHAAGQMTDAMLAQVTRLEHLEALTLDHCDALTGTGLRTLARLPHLKHLSLAGCPAVDDDSLAVLRELSSLETLSIAWTAATDAGLSALAACGALRSVNLMGTRSGDAALRALAGHGHLRTLYTGNEVTVDGLRALREVPAFAHWQGGEPSMGLLDFTAGPTFLLARGPFGAAGLEAVRALEGLFALNVDDIALGLTGDALVALRDHPQLGWLAFDAHDDAMPQIAAMPHLRFLMCQDSPATDDGFVALSRSSSLEYLWGRRCHGLTRRGFEALATMPALRALSVSCLNVDDAGVSALPGFPSLRELMPMDVPDAGYRHIARCEALESLVLMYCRETGDQATRHIHRLPHLRRYFASHTRATDRTPRLLADSPSLEHVTFAGCGGLTSAGIAALARLPTLRRLELGGLPRVERAVVDRFPSGVTVRYGL